PSTATARSAHYPLSLHDALPIWQRASVQAASGRDAWRTTNSAAVDGRAAAPAPFTGLARAAGLGPPLGAGIRTGRLVFSPVNGADRKSTRLNSSHSQNSYAVFCL